MFLPSTVEFCSHRWAERKFCFTVVSREAVPQIHREFGSFAWRQFQELGEGRRRHTSNLRICGRIRQDSRPRSSTRVETEDRQVVGVGDGDEVEVGGSSRGPAGRRSRRRGRGGGWRSRTRWRCIARGVRPGETRMGVGAVGALAVEGAAVTRQDARRFPAGAGRAVEQDSEVSARIMPGADQHHRACHRQASASVIHRAGRGR